MTDITFVKVLLTLLLSLAKVYSQSSNFCGNAEQLCPGITISGGNIGASASTCPSCEDNFNLCFTPFNTVWFKFTSDSNGGNVTITINNLNFNNAANRGNELQACVFSAAAACDGTSYTMVSNCVTAAVGNFSLNANTLLPNTTYYIVVNGAKNGGAILPAEANFDIVISGDGVNDPPPFLGVGVPTALYCPETPYTFSAYFSNCKDTSTTYSWYKNGNLFAQDTSIYLETSLLTQGDMFEIRCTCDSFCSQEYSVSFGPINMDNLYLDASANLNIAQGEEAILNCTSNGTNFLWTPPTSVIYDTAQTTSAFPNTTTTYTITASNENCTLQDQLTVTVGNQLRIPGSFSPNQDGNNDRWIIEGIEKYPYATVEISNRYGNVLANLSGYGIENAWDGRYKDKNVPVGVYFYVISLNDLEGKVLKGSLTVLR